MAKRVTIKSIAEDLGISHMTVSRALSNSPKVREATKKAVLRHAEELGYIKNAAASAMRGDKTAIVGLLLPNLVNEFYARFADGLAASAEMHRLQLLIHLTNDDVHKEQEAIQKLCEIQAKAVVMVPAPGLPAAEKCMADVSVIQLIRTRKISIPSRAVLVDDNQAITNAVHHLADHGHTRIAYIGGDRSLSSGAARLSAFLSGMQAADLTSVDSMVITDTPSFAMGYRSAHELLDYGEVTALLCGGFEISNGALNACLERGMMIPDDLSFIGYGDPSYYRWLLGGISTVEVPVEELATRVAELLSREEAYRDKPLPHHTIRAKLVLRNSTSPACQ